MSRTYRVRFVEISTLLLAGLLLVCLPSASFAQTTSGCGETGEICDSESFCKLPHGSCGAGPDEGVCTPMPQGCVDVWIPVCGCNGNTYSNTCYADRAGVSVFSQGECPRFCGGIGGVECNADEFCKFEPGSCNILSALGTCQPTPEACSGIWDPVCGCDGVTYENACVADQAGAAIDRPGPCDDSCGGLAGIPCDEDAFCKFPDGTCNVADREGSCQPTPQFCPEIYDPVCGCDGRTYDNECFAAQDEVSVNHPGACEQVCGGFSGIVCPSNEYCSFPDGTCEIADRQGVCRPAPDACPEIYDPVCGCDGVTYGNACEAAAAGASVDHPGECEQERVCGGIAGIECPSDEYCMYPDGTCGIADRQGICQALPQGCPDVWDPVCGCDGNTYGNACEAAVSGASIDHPGECEQEQVCGGIAGIECPADEYCMYDEGTCETADRQGICRPVPDVCSMLYDPVCGCDGKTYPNACFATVAGISVDHPGECEPICGGIAGIECPADEYCMYPDGTCEIADRQGTCRPIPQGCPDVWDPVCGCDGNTYGNDCEAAAAGASVDHPGECEQEQVCGGIAGIECPADEYCMYPEGTCDIADRQGICQPVPQHCPLYYDPVCGCDGNTYGNDCEAAAAGVSVDHAGECEPICGGIAGIECPADEYCMYPDGTCEIADRQGTCRPIPQGCPDVWDPVCGCDGNTYGNDCEAAAAGASVDHPGECEQEQVCGGIAGIGCPADEYCMYPEGTCDIADRQGICQPVPQACPLYYDPVCGCDGNTYGNDCEVAAAGVSIDHPGQCAPVCGGIAGIECPPDRYCMYPDGTCQIADRQGVCRLLPEACPAVCDPVCGCDGKTYDNDCLAARAGVSLAHRGECDPLGRQILDVYFVHQERLIWRPSPDALYYNVYWAKAYPPPAEEWTCYLTQLQEPFAAIPDSPLPGELWLFQVTGLYLEGEGQMGRRSDCSDRPPGQGCDPE